MTKQLASRDPEDFHRRARLLGLWGLVENWQKVASADWLEQVLLYEEEVRAQRSLERRVRNAKLGRFKLMCDFDWKWPKKIDREIIDEVYALGFLKESANVVIVGPNGVGKTMIAKNVAHQAVLRGSTARFTTASQLLNNLAAQDSASALERRLRHYCRPELLVIDELGYLSTSADHADLLFELVTRRYQQEKTIVLTTNKSFQDWNEVFPNSGVVVTLVDRLVHRCEVVEIEAESYRLKESEERKKEREKERKARGARKKRKKP